MSDKKEKALIVQYKEEINQQLSDPETLKSLMEVTFKGLEPAVAKRAMLEGYFRGFKFSDFLKKDVYAIPYGQGYTLVTSIDFAQKRADSTGHFAGATEPDFGEDPDMGELKGGVYGKVTVFKMVAGEARPFSAKVYLREYTTQKNLWVSKPRTMLGKVARMHALRIAFPEQLAKVYTEEEFDKENAREGTYQVIRKQEPFDRDGIDDDTVPTVHIGEDHGESKPNLTIDRTSTQPVDIIEQEIPEDELTQRNLLNAKAMKKWPGLTESARLKNIKNLTGVGVEPANYKVIIKMLD